MKIILCFIIITLFSSTIYSQNILKGKVFDSETNNVLPGVNIYFPELNKGTITNENGEYVLTDFPKGKFRAQYSFIGYNTVVKIVQFGNSEVILDIKLESTVIKTHEVVVSGGYYSSQHENAVKIDVINAEKINNSGETNFSETIAGIPGVDMISNGAGIGKPVIRGLSMNEVLVLNNGVRSENQQWSANHPLSLNEFGIEKVEVIKGPASLLYGSDAIGGVINLIKEKPAAKGEISGDYNLKLYSNTQGITNDLGLKGASQHFFGGIRLGIKSHADYLDGNSDFVPNTRFNEKALKANVGFNKSYGIFQLFYDYNKEELGMCVGNVIEDTLISIRGRKNNIWYQNLSNRLLSSHNKLFINNFKVELNAAYQSNLRKLHTTETSPVVNMELNTLTYECKTVLPSDENSEFIVGFQGLNQNNRNFGKIHIIPDADIIDYSFFGLAQYSFPLKSGLKTQIGVRYDNRSIYTEAEGTYGQDDYKPNIAQNFDNVSWSAGATFNLNEKLLFRANLAAGFRSPNLAELTTYGLHGVRFEVGDSQLKPERNIEGDFSIHYHLKYAAFDIAVFDNQISNYIFLSPTSDTSSQGYKIYRYSQNNAELYGGEAGVHIHPHPLDWLHFETTFSTVTGKQDDGNYLPFIPANKLRVELKAVKDTLLIFNNAFIKISTLTAFAQTMPSMFETKADGYSLLNSGIGANIKWSNQTVLIAVSVNNLLNKKYIAHLSTLKPLGIYNQGRNISVFVKIPFGGM